MTTFSNPQASHDHSLQTLQILYEFDDFMESVSTVVDMGCGAGLDLEWWATRTTRDEVPKPLNIKCLGVDQSSGLLLANKYSNIHHQVQDFERPFSPSKSTFDVVWCHDAFQYAINPLATLKSWWEIMSYNGMLVLILPQTTNIEFKSLAYDQRDGCYYNWTLVSLIHALAVSGFDCKSGFFFKDPTNPWLHAVVYKGDQQPQDPRTTRWYDLCDANLLPESLEQSILKYGYARQRDLVLPWLDHSLYSYIQH